MADAAYTLGSTLAQLGLSEATVRRLLAEKLAASDENRAKSLVNVNAGASNRGMLQSSATLQDRANTNLDYDRQVGGYNAGANDDLSRIAQQRLDAQAAYNSSVAEEQARQAAEQSALKPGFDPEDPFNWKGIQAEQLANGTANTITPVAGGTADDPYNWKGIAAQQAAAKPKPTPVPVKPKPPVNERPKVAPRPGAVVRF